MPFFTIFIIICLILTSFYKIVLGYFLWFILRKIGKYDEGFLGTIGTRFNDVSILDFAPKDTAS